MLPASCLTLPPDYATRPQFESRSFTPGAADAMLRRQNVAAGGAATLTYVKVAVPPLALKRPHQVPDLPETAQASGT